MDNGERGRRLMAMAAEYLQDMDAAAGRGCCDYGGGERITEPTRPM